MKGTTQRYDISRIFSPRAHRDLQCGCIIDNLYQASCAAIRKHVFVLSYRVTEEYDLVANPIYNISMQCTAASNPQRGMLTTSNTVATTTRGDTVVPVTYENVTRI